MNIMAAVFFTIVMVGVCVGALVVSIKKPKSKKKCGPDCDCTCGIKK
jgi:hypothetical protein